MNPKRGKRVRIDFTSTLLAVVLLAGLMACQATETGTTGEAVQPSPTPEVIATVPPAPPATLAPLPTASKASPTSTPVVSTPTVASVPAPVGTSARRSQPATPITIEFMMEKAPKLNEPVNVTVTVKSVSDAPNTTASLELPSSAVLVSGTPRFQGNLKKGQPVQFKAVIKFQAEGDWTVKATARCTLSEDDVWGDAAYIYLHVGREQSHFGFAQSGAPPAPVGGEEIPPAITASPDD